MVRRQIFLVVYGLANIGLVLYGLLALIMPAALLEDFAAHVYQLPPGAAATYYLLALYRLLGFFNLTVGAGGLFLLRQLQVNLQPLAGRLAMLTSLAAYLGPIVFDNTVGHIGPAEILEHILFAAMVVTGLNWLRP